MIADLLLRAARKLRECATEANTHRPAPWFDGPYDSVPEYGVFPAFGVTPIVTVEDKPGRQAIVAYVAMMHPTLGLALANWLELEANMVAQRGGPAEGNSPEGHTFCAVTVAREILREPQ
jgi:hypothetical protein